MSPNTEPVYQHLQNDPEARAAIARLNCKLNGHVWDYNNTRKHFGYNDRERNEAASTCVRCGELLRYPRRK